MDSKMTEQEFEWEYDKYSRYLGLVGWLVIIFFMIQNIQRCYQQKDYTFTVVSALAICASSYSFLRDLTPQYFHIHITPHRILYWISSRGKLKTLEKDTPVSLKAGASIKMNKVRGIEKSDIASIRILGDRTRVIVTLKNSQKHFLELKGLKDQEMMGRLFEALKPNSDFGGNHG